MPFLALAPRECKHLTVRTRAGLGGVRQWAPHTAGPDGFGWLIRPPAGRGRTGWAGRHPSAQRPWPNRKTGSAVANGMSLGLSATA